jgi:hypothetical protein
MNAPTPPQSFHLPSAHEKEFEAVEEGGVDCSGSRRDYDEQDTRGGAVRVEDDLE